MTLICSPSLSLGLWVADRRRLVFALVYGNFTLAPWDSHELNSI
jgi:hypothetical protein